MFKISTHVHPHRICVIVYFLYTLCDSNMQNMVFVLCGEIEGESDVFHCPTLHTRGHILYDVIGADSAMHQTY